MSAPHTLLADRAEAERFIAQTPRDRRGRFSVLRCVNAHDRCYGGAGGPCPYCEVRQGK